MISFDETTCLTQCPDLQVENEGVCVCEFLANAAGNSCVETCSETEVTSLRGDRCITGTTAASCGADAILGDGNLCECDPSGANPLVAFDGLSCIDACPVGQTASEDGICECNGPT